jgi:mono/diheme cytochrome c family protein
VNAPLKEKAGGGRVVSATLAAALALASACGLSLSLRRIESKTSHQQPTPEAWFETSTPSSPMLIKQGRALYLSSCAHCHGADASGDEGPDLHDVEVSDRYISNTITRGIRGEMPSFRKKLKSDDIVRLTAYLRSISPNSARRPPG